MVERDTVSRKAAQARSAAVLLCVFLLALVGAAAAPVAAEAPASLEDAGEHAEDLYDSVKAREWSKAAGQMALLEKDIVRAGAEVRGQAANKERLGSAGRSLAGALKIRDRHLAMVEANRITAIVTDMSEPYHARAPLAVSRLDYYGRELEIWAAAGNLDRLKTTATDIGRTWEGLRPEAVAHHGGAEAQRFDRLVAQLGNLKRPHQYSRVAKSILDEVDNLEKVFSRTDGRSSLSGRAGD